MLIKVIFETLNTALTSAPLLAFPDFSSQFITQCDSLNVEVGAVIGQIRYRDSKKIEFELWIRTRT